MALTQNELRERAVLWRGLADTAQRCSPMLDDIEKISRSLHDFFVPGGRPDVDDPDLLIEWTVIGARTVAKQLTDLAAILERDLVSAGLAYFVDDGAAVIGQPPDNVATY